MNHEPLTIDNRFSHLLIDHELIDSYCPSNCHQSTSTSSEQPPTCSASFFVTPSTTTPNKNRCEMLLAPFGYQNVAFTPLPPSPAP